MPHGKELREECSGSYLRHAELFLGRIWCVSPGEEKLADSTVRHASTGGQDAVMAPLWSWTSLARTRHLLLFTERTPFRTERKGHSPDATPCQCPSCGRQADVPRTGPPPLALATLAFSVSPSTTAGAAGATGPSMQVAPYAVQWPRSRESRPGSTLPFMARPLTSPAGSPVSEHGAVSNRLAEPQPGIRAAKRGAPPADFVTT